MTHSPCTSTKRRLDLSTDIYARFLLLVMVPERVSHHCVSGDHRWRLQSILAQEWCSARFRELYICSPKSPYASYTLFPESSSSELTSLLPISSINSISSSHCFQSSISWKCHCVLVEGFHLALNLHSEHSRL